MTATAGMSGRRASREQHRRRGQVGVPDVVVGELEVPEVLAGVGLDRDQAGPNSVVTGRSAGTESTDGAPNGR